MSSCLWLSVTDIDILSDTDTNTDMNDTDIQFAETDILVSVLVSAKYISRPIYQSSHNIKGSFQVLTF